ncbi:MAG: hypothetical protein ACJAR2_002659 [Ilumatobacter sp.]|jgi:hypothetical protein
MTASDLPIARVAPSYRIERWVRSAPRSHDASSLGRGVGTTRLVGERRTERFVRPNWRVAELSQHPVGALEGRENSNGARAMGEGRLAELLFPRRPMTEDHQGAEW